MIVAGTRDAVLNQVQVVSIHGTILYDLVYTHVGETQPRQARLGSESLYAEPQPGDLIRVQYMMNVATTVEHRTG
ncbi:hypothetical protein EYB53_010140 [Candidatus Chloroploca sp. M-50]|uniref:Uncharacterized protein n=1 Tax=Candidatus Chloroploca mongolica TaxID=2528176 RepID=A0ABS4D9F2_9CHLR|nr:hypothetical protein [Candidatus Chloroploca mongolica]MBP1466062.1 hypothetical protein [Candidatus Chloroploca mongolica]